MKKLDDIILKNITHQGGSNFEKEQSTLFISVLNNIKEPLPTMIELGSNDSYYSILFNKFFDPIPTINVCVEISNNLINLGKSNVEHNSCTNFKFKHARVGRINTKYFEGVLRDHPNLLGDVADNTITIQSILQEFNIEKLSLIHMDIQGSEISVLEEIRDNKIPIEYFFISTHPTQAEIPTHDPCIKILNEIGVEYIYNNPRGGGYGDGLIIGRKI